MRPARKCVTRDESDARWSLGGAAGRLRWVAAAIAFLPWRAGAPLPAEAGKQPVESPADAAAASPRGPYLLVNAETGRVYDHFDALRPWFPASTTKLMTAY